MKEWWWYLQARRHDKGHPMYSIHSILYFDGWWFLLMKSNSARLAYCHQHPKASNNVFMRWGTGWKGTVSPDLMTSFIMRCWTEFRALFQVWLLFFHYEKEEGNLWYIVSSSWFLLLGRFLSVTYVLDNETWYLFNLYSRYIYLTLSRMVSFQ